MAVLIVGAVSAAAIGLILTLLLVLTTGVSLGLLLAGRSAQFDERPSVLVLLSH